MQAFARSATVACAVLLSSAAASAQAAPPAPPAKRVPTVAPTTPSQPPVNTRAKTGPGTQTEDDVYVGVKRQVQGVNKPETTGKPPARPGAGTSPNTGRGSGGDDDLDDLEVERRTVQGVERPSTGTPQLRPGAGTSPNTGRTAGTMRGPSPSGQPPKKP